MEEPCVNQASFRRLQKTWLHGQIMRIPFSISSQCELNNVNYRLSLNGRLLECPLFFLLHIIVVFLWANLSCIGDLDLCTDAIKIILCTPWKIISRVAKYESSNPSCSGETSVEKDIHTSTLC